MYVHNNYEDYLIIITHIVIYNGHPLTWIIFEMFYELILNWHNYLDTV